MKSALPPSNVVAVDFARLSNAKALATSFREFNQRLDSLFEFCLDTLEDMEALGLCAEDGNALEHIKLFSLVCRTWEIPEIAISGLENGTRRFNATLIPTMDNPSRRRS